MPDGKDAGRKTIYDVARLAGVSISTVSLAINHPHRVNEKTRRAVIASATQLGYRGAPSSGAGPRIAVAAPFSSYPSYFRRLAGMMTRGHLASVELVIHDLPSTAAENAPVLDVLPIRSGIDGIIVMGAPLSREAIETESLPGPPVVLVDVPDSAQRRLHIPTILIDDQAGGALIGRHLASLGHTTVAFVHEAQRSLDYVSAGMLRARGLAEHVTVIDVRSEDDGAVARSLRDALSHSPGITAIVANHDELAATVHAALDSEMSEASLALVGYDDGPLAEALNLTTVRQPFEESGYAALDLLLGLISGERASVSTVQLSPQLVVRQSTSPR